MAPLPKSVIADGNLRVLWVPALANPAAPTLTELTTSTAVDLSCYLTGFTQGTNENTVTDDRLCARQVYSRMGSHTEDMSWTYIYQPQGKAALDNLAQATLVEGAEGYIVQRWGKDASLPFATGDVVDTMPAQCGVQRKAAPTRNETLKIEQTVYITGPVNRDVTIPAGA